MVINELFLLAKKLLPRNYVNDIRQFSFLVKKKADQVINNLHTNFRTLKEWIYHNFVILNPKKCHLMNLRNDHCNFACDDIIIKNLLWEKILRLTIDNNLNFRYHTSNIYKNANEKLYALFRVSAIMK